MIFDKGAGIPSLAPELAPLMEKKKKPIYHLLWLSLHRQDGLR